MCPLTLARKIDIASRYALLGKIIKNIDGQRNAILNSSQDPAVPYNMQRVIQLHCRLHQYIKVKLVIYDTVYGLRRENT